MTMLSDWSAAVGLPSNSVGASIHTRFVYRFEGAAFSDVGDSPLSPGSFLPGDRIVGWVALDEPLAPNLQIFSAGWQTLASGISYAFDNSRGSMTGLSASSFSWTVSTDATGRILEWYVSGGVSPWSVAIGTTFLNFSSQFEFNFGGEGPWGQDQAGFGIRLDSSHAYSDSAFSSNTPGGWLAPVEIKSGTLNSEIIRGTGLASVLNGYSGNDRIFGNGGRDEIHAGSGNDNILGGSGNDYIWGDSGADTLVGGTGADTLIGGGGTDSFLFSPGCGRDQIRDFEIGIDKIAITLDAGNLSDLHFRDFAGGMRIYFGDVLVTVLHHTTAEMSVVDNFVFV